MKKLLFRKSLLSVILLTTLLFSLTATITPLAQADKVGVGKFLKVAIEGGGHVTATKVKTGDVWFYYPTDAITEHKLGAGTVLIETFVDEGWEFSHWEDIEGNEIGNSDSFNYKAVKYGYFKAVFVQIKFKITATVFEDAPNGTITTFVDNVEYTATATNPLTVYVEVGTEQLFTFNPFIENHVSLIQVDASFIASATSFTTPPVTQDLDLTVFFSQDGAAYVPIGTNIPVSLSDSVSLSFISTTGAGTATEEEITLLGDLQDTYLLLWNVDTDVTFSEKVTVTLPYYATEVPEHVFLADTLDILYSDVNADGVVNGDDVSDVANGIKTTSRSGAEYDAQWDVNRDGDLTEDDVHMVNENKGATIYEVPIEDWDVDLENDIIVIQTPHFSIFRGR